MAIVNRFRAAFERRAEQQEYTLLNGQTSDNDDDDDSNRNPSTSNNAAHRPTAAPSPQSSILDDDTLSANRHDSPFSWLEYSVFFLLGIAMLWAWNMYLAAAPYFAKRFAADPWILTHFQSAIISVGTVTNLISMLVLASRQATASYTHRIGLALFINMGIFTLLAVSTVFVRDAAPNMYLAFVLGCVFCTSCATGLFQNGAFALAAAFGHPAYTQAIMTGQAIAGVLPPIAQILTVIAVPKPHTHAEGEPLKQNSAAALVYFLTATVVSLAATVVFVPLVHRHARLISKRAVVDLTASVTSVQLQEQAQRKVVPLIVLYRKLGLFAGAVFVCFCGTMFFPVFTSQILSTTGGNTTGGDEKAGYLGRLAEPAVFVPLAFLFWNIGDLMGRLATLLPFTLVRRPKTLLALAFARLAFLPLYQLCNIKGRGPEVGGGSIWGDVFYLFIVQIGFGLTNGWVGGSCMMGAGMSKDVVEGEAEAVGGFMGLNLVAGLTVGSLLSFAAG